MKYLVPALLVTIFFVHARQPVVVHAEKKITVHFFESALCPVCKKAKIDFVDFKRNNKNLNVITYQVRNKDNKISAANRRNINKLLVMLRRIDKNVGGRAFIIKDRKKYELRIEKGIPYYLKRISKTTVIKKELPVPIFIIGDKVIIGYTKHIVKREIED